MKGTIVLIFILAAVLAGAASSHAHVPKKTGAAGISRKARSSALSATPFLKKIITWQRALQSRIVKMARELKVHFSVRHLLIMLSIAILYGIIHALGPGHGKIILGSCAIGEQYPARTALKASLIFSAVHNGSAILLYTLFILFFGALNRRTSHDITTVMYHVSGGMLFLLGLALLAAAVLKKEAHSHLPEKMQNLSLPLACAAAGAVPCPGTLILLFFGGSLGMVWLGYILALGFTAGMLFTLSLVALLVTSGRNIATVSLKNEAVIKILRITGAVLLMVVGIYLFLLY